MFTGLVELTASVETIVPEGPGVRIVIDAGHVADGVETGDSISICGCCLTVVEIEGTRLSFQAGEETLKRTTLGRFKPGGPVNLERSLRVGDRMGGHFVTGHVDGMGEIAKRNDDSDWSTFWFKVPQSLMVEIASKGSVTVDGISLTVVDTMDDQFSVALIPHTLEKTTLGGYGPGSHVNIETDVLAKYVRRQREADTASN